MRRTSHALGDGERSWLVDVVDHPRLDEWIEPLGRPVGVLQLLDRHERGCAAVADRLGVPHHVVPESLPGSPFELRPIVRRRWWREVALWWPERSVLVCADVIGTAPFFRAGDDEAGMHPFLRLWPPHALDDLEPDHLLVGHGEGIHDPLALAHPLATARRRFPRWLLGLPRLLRRGY